MERKRKINLLERLHYGSIDTDEFASELERIEKESELILGGPIWALINKAIEERPKAYQKLLEQVYDNSNADLYSAIGDCLLNRPAAVRGIARCCEYKDENDPICSQCISAIKVEPFYQ